MVTKSNMAMGLRDASSAWLSALAISANNKTQEVMISGDARIFSQDYNAGKPNKEQIE